MYVCVSVVRISLTYSVLLYSEVCYINNIAVDNRFVVPYNSYLLKRFDTHICVEFCGSVKSIKYVVKYEFKGQDLATITIEKQNTQTEEEVDKHDEVKMYENMRYISSMNATWRIFDLPLCGHTPAIYRLQIHLEDNQTVWLKHN